MQGPGHVIRQWPKEGNIKLMANRKGKRTDAQKQAQRGRTKRNKINSIMRELRKNPNNINARKAVEKWQSK